MSGRDVDKATAAARGAGRPASGPGRWISAIAAGAAVVGVVVVAQLATDGGVERVPDGPAAGAAPAAPAVVPDQRMGGGVATAAALFPADAIDSRDTVREATVDVAASWPVQGCAGASTSDTGRLDFVSGIERGPGYSRDLAIGWYVDASAAQAAYDGLMGRVQQCAADAGDQASTQSLTPSAAAGSLLTVWSAPTDTPFVDGSTYAALVSGKVVVLAVDHSEMLVDGATSPAAFPGTAAHADRLVVEACRVSPDSC